MDSYDTTNSHAQQPEKTRWNAVFAMAFSIAILLITELLPVSILTPMAQGLDISQGLAGQSLTATALVAIFSSLLITRVTTGIDRRHVLLGFSVILAVSNLLVAFAPNFLVLCAGRLLLGIALGGFWAITPSITMRLSTQAQVSKALSIVFGGISVALVIAAPLGSYLGHLIGWRGVFIATAALGALCSVWQIVAIPNMPSTRAAKLGDIWRVAKQPTMIIGMLAILFVFCGQFTFFSYMRPYYEGFVGLDTQSLSLMFLGFGVANFIGTSLSSRWLDINLKATLAVSPIVIGISAIALAIFGQQLWVAVVFTVVWGFVFGAVPVGWSTWVTRAFPNETENAGGLQVATIQFANTIGAAAGGYLLDVGNETWPVLCAGILMLVTALVVITRLPSR